VGSIVVSLAKLGFEMSKDSGTEKNGGNILVGSISGLWEGYMALIPIDMLVSVSVGGCG
jgi:hypothetical protein